MGDVRNGMFSSVSQRWNDPQDYIGYVTAEPQFVGFAFADSLTCCDVFNPHTGTHCAFPVSHRLRRTAENVSCSPLRPPDEVKQATVPSCFSPDSEQVSTVQVI